MRYGVAAEYELADAVDTYDRERAGLGDEFLREVQRTASFLIDHPQLGRLVRKNRRVLVLNKFPYQLIYDIDKNKNSIRIIAVAHQSRRSDYWWGRVEEAHPQYGSLLAFSL